MHQLGKMRASYSIMKNPASRLPATIARPYALPNSMAGGAALLFGFELELPPARPVKTWFADAVLVAGMVVMVEVLTRVGFRAPHGCPCVQELAQLLSLPHPFTHWTPHSVQTKYGSVREYSETLG